MLLARTPGPCPVSLVAALSVGGAYQRSRVPSGLPSACRFIPEILPGVRSGPGTGLLTAVPAMNKQSWCSLPRSRVPAPGEGGELRRRLRHSGPRLLAGRPAQLRAAISTGCPGQAVAKPRPEGTWRLGQGWGAVRAASTPQAVCDGAPTVPRVARAHRGAPQGSLCPSAFRRI